MHTTFNLYVLIQLELFPHNLFLFFCIEFISLLSTFSMADAILSNMSTHKHPKVPKWDTLNTQYLHTIQPIERHRGIPRGNRHFIIISALLLGASHVLLWFGFLLLGFFGQTGRALGPTQGGCVVAAVYQIAEKRVLSRWIQEHLLSICVQFCHSHVGRFVLQIDVIFSLWQKFFGFYILKITEVNMCW